MEAWIVAAVAVLTLIYQAVIGPQSVMQWYRRQRGRTASEELARGSEAEEAAASVNITPRQVLGSSFQRGYRFVQEHPWETLKRVGISVAVAFGGLIALFLVAGVFLALVGAAFSVSSAEQFGMHLMGTSVVALFITFLVTSVIGLFLMLVEVML